MFAMPGFRAFSLAAARGPGGVSCDVDGVYVGDIPLLTCCEASGADKRWVVRPISELNNELSALYRLPVDAARKANALQLIATALNRGDIAMAAIATVQMEFPDPPSLAKGVESRAEVERRATELYHSGLLKFWDPAKHPRAGTSPNPGWFAPIGEEAEAAAVVPVAMPDKWGWPWEKPLIVEGGVARRPSRTTGTSVLLAEATVVQRITSKAEASTLAGEFAKSPRAAARRSSGNPQSAAAFQQRRSHSKTQALGDQQLAGY